MIVFSALKHSTMQTHRIEMFLRKWNHILTVGAEIITFGYRIFVKSLCLINKLQ